ncbi:DNA damage-binding protein 1 [Chionoecetes opilio]|uniref:DNA damage-binding protein 1 n=1 Tax=Chionoecetes opilio TaxID=41210 RepID=A0A8J5CTL5_CHIOP|nr:DNA damage-binding protein 1 [Chionoecetes opilio]
MSAQSASREAKNTYLTHCEETEEPVLQHLMRNGNRCRRLEDSTLEILSMVFRHGTLVMQGIPEASTVTQGCVLYGTVHGALGQGRYCSGSCNQTPSLLVEG